MRDQGYAFVLSVSMHFNKKHQEAGRRFITFACETEQQRDKWMAAIEYLKTRAIYDQYAKRKHIVHFLKPATNEYLLADENGGERDVSDLLYNFGDKLKQASIQTSSMASVVA